MSVGVRRTPIRALTHGSNDFLLVGVIIAKQAPHSIKPRNAIMETLSNNTKKLIDNDRLGSRELEHCTVKVQTLSSQYRGYVKIVASEFKSNHGTRRCVWNFTLRDSPADFINVSFWGSQEFIENIAINFHIGDVVDVVKAKVSFRKNEDANFMPDVTSPLLLTMNENIAEMCLHSEHDCAEFHRLLRLPTRPPGDYVTLSDVHSNGHALRGKYVNLLVAVCSIGTIRQVTTRQENKQIDSREVEVMDHSPTSLYMQLWDAETVYRADNWKPRETILFISDIRLNWNSFKKSMTATVTPRTIITENPDINEAHQLREHSRTAPTIPTAILDQIATNYPDPSAINVVMSCQAVWNKAVNAESAESFTALVMAALIEVDVDGLASYTTSKCQYCQLLVDDTIGLCGNPDCPVSSGLERPVVQRVFDLQVSLADHTGTLPKCRITSSAAEVALNCSPEEFDSLTLDSKTSLKWQFLLKRCASRLVILPATRDRLSPLFSIVALEKVTLTDYAARLPMY